MATQQQQKQQDGTRTRGRPPGSKTRRTQEATWAPKPGKKRKQNASDIISQGSSGKGARKERGNAETKSFTTRILPGYHKHLPPAAQDLVEQALFGSDLADAPADDPRWTQLYQDLHSLIDTSPTSRFASETEAAATTRTAVDVINQPQEEVVEDEYEWAPASPSSPPPARDLGFEKRDEAQAAHVRSTLVSTALSAAVHARVSSELTNNKGSLAKDLGADSWDPNSLAALSMLVEEIAKSQAKFNAQRTMFAKSCRNQALAAKRLQHKRKGTADEEDERRDAS
ncbi:uncharacterized protein UBRO_05603 [Ustilago bromivora]|uniref:Uncharacterized protein n=1 Tax=Ustilago bromivora TaxID=307758 RepID=A0A1K0G989_9BASI|nr:uncharacterized protein UBRO_05603 [Ustilago bromivora]SYW85153.1 uncharacterized protein UBRO2_05724 [Ustilago bromivora]